MGIELGYDRQYECDIKLSRHENGIHHQTEKCDLLKSVVPIFRQTHLEKRKFGKTDGFANSNAEISLEIAGLSSHANKVVAL